MLKRTYLIYKTDLKYTKEEKANSLKAPKKKKKDKYCFFIPL